MKRYMILFTFCLWTIHSFSQKVFFQSGQQFSKEQLSVFYSSISLHGNKVLFNANDHKIYLYDKQDGSLKWEYNLKRKTDVPALLNDQLILATGDKGVVVIDPNNGSLVKKLPISVLETTPEVKNGIIYGTGILDGGCVFGYVPGQDTVLWKRFIAHGSAVRPFYFKNLLTVNMEGEQWFRMGYNGRLPDPLCESLDHPIPDALPCVKKGVGFSHNGWPIKREDAEKLFSPNVEQPEISNTDKRTFLYSEGQLVILGKKQKRQASIDITSLSDSLPNYDDGFSRLLKTDESNVSLMQGNWYLIYNYKKKRLLTAVDLSPWQPHQVVIDDRRLWVISKKDGLLYGISL